MSCYPKILYENIILFSQENKLIKRYDPNYEIEINKSSEEIILLCDGSHDIESIAKKIIEKNKYHVNLDMVCKDIIDLLEILYEFGAVSLSPINPFEYKHTFEFGDYKIKKVWYDEVANIELSGLMNPSRSDHFFEVDNRLKLKSLNILHEYKLFDDIGELGLIILSNEIYGNIYVIEYMKINDISKIDLVLKACEFIVKRENKKSENSIILYKGNNRLENSLIDNGYSVLYKEDENSIIIVSKNIKR